MGVSNESRILLMILLALALVIMLYTANTFSHEADDPSRLILDEDIRKLLGPRIPDLPGLRLSRGSEPFTIDLQSIVGNDGTLKEIQNANAEEITIAVEGTELTLTFNPSFVGATELDFMITRPNLLDPIVKTMKIDIYDVPESEADFFSKATSVDEKLDLPHDCLPPYFPEAPLTPEKLKMCHPDWIDSQTFYSKCDSDPTCKKCIKDHHRSKAKILNDAIRENRERMHNEIGSILTERGVLPGATLLLQMLNAGYYYHWANFICSCDANNIIVRNYTLVVVFDDESERRATEAGFMVYQPKWIPVKIDEHAASSFALGPHGVIMVFEHMMRNELVQLGYDVMFQDTDIIWRKDPMPWLQNTHPRLDIQVMYDGRTDGVGPINSGFIFTRSNCRTKIYLQTMIDNIVFFLWDRASQPFVNALVHHRKFRQISMRLLDVELFMNGNRWPPTKPPDNWGEEGGPDPFVMHASWTGNHLDKINKWNQVDQWYLNPQCSLWDPDIFTDKVCDRLKNQTGIDCKAPKETS